MIGQRTSIRDDATCLDCDRPLSHLQRVSGTRFCGEVCRGRHAALAVHEVCTICGRRLAPRQFGERLCENLGCRRRLEERAAERERHRIDTLWREARRLRDEEAESLGVAQPDRYPPVLIPAIRRALVPLEEPRRRAFQNRLSRLIAEASARLGGPPGKAEAGQAANSGIQTSPAVAAVTRQACGLCRGWCCQTGGNHAYLTVEVLQRRMTAHPEQDPSDVLANYLRHLGDDSIEGSCIFHQVDGCGLPPELRSDTCNRFYCAGLAEYRDWTTAQDQDAFQGFFAATVDTTVVTAAFCDENGPKYVSGTTEHASKSSPDAE